MSDLLANIYTVPGVHGAALYNKAGECLEHRLPLPYEPDILGAILSELFVGLEGYTYVERAPLRMGMVTFTHGVLGIMRTVHHSAVVLASESINPSLLTVAFGALEVKLAELSSHQTRELSAASLDVVTPELLQTAAEILAEYVGPMAHLLMEEHVATLGYSDSTFPPSAWSGLVDVLSHEITPPTRQQELVDRLQNLVN